MFRLISLAFIMLISFSTTELHGQILKRILRESQRKVERKVENMVVQKASEAISDAIMRSIEDSFDKKMKEAYKQDSTQRADDPDYNDSLHLNYSDYAGFLAAMNRAADLPESYSFDMSMEMLIEQNEDEKEFTWHMSRTGEYMAMEQPLKKGRMLILMDFERDINVLYREDEEGNKSVQAMPSMMDFMKMAMDEEEIENDMTFEKTGRKRTIIGYNAFEYTGKNDDGSYTIFMAPDFPISWTSAYRSMIEQYALVTRMNDKMDMEGMVLASVTELDDDEGTIRMEATGLSEKGWTLDNSEYELKGIQEK